MPTLSVVKHEFITTAKWIALITASIIALVVLLKLIFFIKDVIAPSPNAPPTVSFGKLPAVFFPDGIKSDYSYSVDTLSGNLPQFSDRANVYKVAIPNPNLLSVDRANKRALTLGFTSNATRLSDNLYQWENDELPPKVLTVNVNMAQFNFSSSFLTDPNVLTANNLPDQKGAKELAQSFLQTLEMYPSDIDPNKTLTKSLTIDNGVIKDATSLSNTNLISVYFFQKDIDHLPVVYPGALSSMNLTVGGGSTDAQIVDARFFYQKAEDKPSTYPIKSASEALKELESGKGYIASYDEKDSKILIKKVYLAYYFQGQKQKYLTPVIVFEGNGNFIAYVSAIKAEWIDN